jgi:hypothetical protein
METKAEPIGGFDFLIGYNYLALLFRGAELGPDLADCGWEYFTYRYIDLGGDEYPQRAVRLVGMADVNNGTHHPDWACLNGSDRDTLATLTFGVGNDRTLLCTFQPVQFYWRDCGDNTISTADGDSLAFSQRIYDPDGKQIQDFYQGPPGFFGAHDSCLGVDWGRVTPFRSVDYVNGGIQIECIDSIDVHGDLNLNGVSNEIADAVMYVNYFMDSVSAFGNHVEGSIAASDVNADGIILSLEDLVYQIRIIVGDARPYAYLPNTVAEITIRKGRIFVNSPADIGAIFMVFAMSQTTGGPVLDAPNMTMATTLRDGRLRVLVYDIGPDKIPAGTKDIMHIPGTATPASIEIAGYEGYSIRAILRPSP